MSVSREDVLHVARLARLRLSDEEADRFAEQLGAILEHVDVLDRVDTVGVDAITGVAEGSAPRRSEGEAPDDLNLPPAELAPAWRDGFFTVPRLAALDTGALEEPFEDKASAASDARLEGEGGTAVDGAAGAAVEGEPEGGAGEDATPANGAGDGER